jgi:hypothetical protein
MAEIRRSVFVHVFDPRYRDNFVFAGRAAGVSYGEDQESRSAAGGDLRGAKYENEKEN